MKSNDNVGVQGCNAPDILARVDAIEKACREIRKVVLDAVGSKATAKPSPKPARQFEYADSTFLYECMDDTRNQRLTALFVGLKQLNLIDQRTPLKQFIDLFSGQPLYHRIRWTGGKAQLAYLFKQLIKQKKYVTTPGSRIWLTVRSHFVQVSGQPFGEDIKAQQMPGEKPAASLDLLVELLNPGKAIPSVRPSRDE